MMRPSILPLLLSLFIAFSVLGKPVNNTSYESTSFANALKAKAITKKNTKKTTAVILQLKEAVGTTKKTVKKPGIMTPRPAAKNEAFASNEDFSYKNIVIGTPSEKFNSKNLSAAEAGISPTESSLFRKGFFYGLALTVVMLNFICYFLFEEKVFLFYSIALATVSIVLFNNDGLLALFGIEMIENGFLVESMLLVAAVSASAVFAQKYLNISEFFPKLRWITSLLLASATVLVVTAWIMNSIAITIASNTLLFTVLTTYFAAGVLLFSRKNYAKFYVIAAFIPLLFAVDFYVLKPAGFHFLFTETVHLKVALFVEMIILTYAIMFRMKALKEEHIIRQTEMRIFIRRQESMNRHNVEMLMEDVYLENLIMHYDLDGLEIKLLQYISEGKENEKIARKLKMTEENVESLTKDLYMKLEIGEHIQEDYRMVSSQPDYIYN